MVTLQYEHQRGIGVEVSIKTDSINIELCTNVDNYILSKHTGQSVGTVTLQVNVQFIITWKKTVMQLPKFEVKTMLSLYFMNVGIEYIPAYYTDSLSVFT